MASIDWSKIPRLQAHRQLGPRPPWFTGAPVSQVAIDPRGRVFATMGARGGRLFHATTGELVAPLEGSANRGSTSDRFVFTEEGRLLGFLNDRVIRLWDAETGALVRAFEEIACESLSGADARGERVLVRDAKASPVVIDLATGARMPMASRPFGGVGRAAFLANGTVVGLSSGDDFVFCWDAATGEERWRVSHARFGSAIVAPPFADWFALGGKSGGALVCDAATGSARAEVPGTGPTWVRHLSATPDGARLLVTSAGAVLYHVPEDTVLERIRVDPELAGALSSDGAWFVLATESGDLSRHGAAAAAAQRHAGHRDRIEWIAFDAAGDVVARERGGRTLTWPAAGGAPREGGTIPADPPVPAWAAAREREIDRDIAGTYLTSDYAGLVGMRGNETLAISLDNYGIRRVWRRDAPGSSYELSPGAMPGAGTMGTVAAVALHPDGRRLAIGTTRPDTPIQLWDGIVGVPIAILEGHEGSVFAVAFDSTGERLVSGGEDRVVRLWTVPAA